jgi:uncharacterized membrane protein YhfC
LLITNIIVSAVCIILLPLVTGYFIARRFKFSFIDFRKLFLAGALTFIASQILHIPFLIGLTALFKNGVLPAPAESYSLIFNAVLLGLLAGIFEETARYMLFTYIFKTWRSWNEGVTVGLGHGGIEAILTGILALSTFAQMTAMRGMTDFSKLGIPADQLDAVQIQIAAYWSQPAVMPLFGFFERISAMSLHIGLSVIVLYSIASGKRKWFWFALFWHAFVDALAVYLYPKIATGKNIVLGTLELEFLIAVISVGVLVYAIRLRNSFPVKKEAEID